MKRIKESKRDQGVMFSDYYVGDRLSADDEVFLFEKFFDKLDISEVTSKYSREGGMMFSPRDQLAILAFAHYKGITSSVKIAEMIRCNLQFIYLSGGHIIARRTICDFRVKHIEALRKIFESSVRLASESGLVSSGNPYALDGTKIKAFASFSKTRRREEWEERQQEIKEKVDKYIKDCEEQDVLEDDYEKEKAERFRIISERIKNLEIPEPEKKIKKDIINDEKKNEVHKKKPQKAPAEDKNQPTLFKKNRIKIDDIEGAEKYLNEYEHINSMLESNRDAGSDTFLNLTDPECRVMKTGKTTDESYNMQAITTNQIIVALDLTPNENDQAQLVPMVDQLKNNIELKEEISLLCDAGYNRGKNLAYVENEHFINPYISMNNRKSDSKNQEELIYEKENFKYKVENNCWECPAGKHLEFTKSFYRDGKPQTLYTGKIEECIYCDHYKKCVTVKADIKRGYRTIEDDGCLTYRINMKNKMKQKDSKKIYSKRSTEVEAVFGQIKSNRGFTGLRLKGIKKARGECLFMAIAHNIGKIMKGIGVKNRLKECYA